MFVLGICPMQSIVAVRFQTKSLDHVSVLPRSMMHYQRWCVHVAADAVDLAVVQMKSRSMM
jgi:hypothetical protein